MNIYILGFLIYINIVIILLSEDFMTTLIGFTITSFFLMVWFILFGWNKVTLICIGCDPGSFWYKCAPGTGEKGPICRNKKKLVELFQNLLKRVINLSKTIFIFAKNKIDNYYSKIKPKLDRIFAKIKILISKVSVIFDISKVFNFLREVPKKCDRNEKIMKSTKVNINTGFFVNGLKVIPLINTIPGIKKLSGSNLTIIPEISKPISDAVCALVKVKKTISKALSCAFIFITYFFQEEYMNMAKNVFIYKYNLLKELFIKIKNTILPLLDIAKLLFSFKGIRTLIDFVYHSVFSVFANYLPGFNPMTILIIISFLAVLPIFAFIIIVFKIQIIIIKLVIWVLRILLGIN